MQVVIVLTSLDTKSAEAGYIADQLRAQDVEPHLMDLSVMGDTPIPPDTSAAQVIAAGGSTLEELRKNPTRQAASPLLIAGATKLIRDIMGERRSCLSGQRVDIQGPCLMDAAT